MAACGCGVGVKGLQSKPARRTKRVALPPLPLPV